MGQVDSPQVLLLIPRGGHMKVNRGAKVALAVLAVAGLAVGALSPATAATRSTVVIVDANTFTSLNPSQPDHNLVLNSNVAYLSGIGFNYYNNKVDLVRNTTFGSYKITSRTASEFKVKYTVKKGVKWSDGTPITGVDLLLSNVISSNAYSIAAGLGDPSGSTLQAFDSLGYNGAYSDLIKDVSIASDRMSVVLTYKKFFPDWELYGPGPSPVHALMALANGEKKLGTYAHNVALKSKFLTAYQSKDTATLKKIAKVWSDAYDITTVDSKTNPLLLVGNGPYQVSSIVKDQTVTMKLNPNYNSGPETSGIETVVFKTIPDPTAAAQALANKEVDVYEAIATADSVAALNKIGSAVNVDGFAISSYEHVEVRSGASQGAKDKYTGPFAGYSQQAKDLRTAFLLAYPRQEIIDKIVKPVNSKAVVMNSLQYFPGESNYKKMVADSGAEKFTDGTQAQRTAAALALVKKYYPNAGTTGVKIKMLWGQPSNTRRSAEAALVKAEEAKAGFDVNVTPTASWSTFLEDNSYDAQFYAWSKTAVTQAGNYSSYKTTESQTGYSNATVDDLISSLETDVLTSAQIYAKYVAVEKILIADAVSIPIFQWPGVVAYNSSLKGMDPAPLSPTVLWNVWDWHF